MGKECLQILLNLKLAEEERTDVDERYMFNTCMQNVEGPIDRYVNRLRKHAATCEFGTLTDEFIRDRLVLGIRDESTKLRLLKDKLDLNKTLHICRSNEIASSQLKAMSSDSNKAQNKEEIRVVRERKSKSPQKSRSTKQIQRKDASKSEFTRKKKYKCYNCGGSERHKLQDCPAYGRECKTCGKRNHFASVCLSKRSDDV
ncbi:uncharacterized protein [Montipora capricornis]|uniref:uncharacterized protein n=1 Tax=Montipora capricornis TaxID=246305 RepID=UPI0035F12A45